VIIPEDEFARRGIRRLCPLVVRPVTHSAPPCGPLLLERPKGFEREVNRKSPVCDDEVTELERREPDGKKLGRMGGLVAPEPSIPLLKQLVERRHYGFSPAQWPGPTKLSNYPDTLQAAFRT